MSSHALVQAALDADADLVAVVGNRIYPDLAEDGTAYPFVVFKRTRYKALKGVVGIKLGEEESFVIECWAHTRSDSVALSELVFDALDIAGLDADEAEPDGIDPELLERVTAIAVEI